MARAVEAGKGDVDYYDTAGYDAYHEGAQVQRLYEGEAGHRIHQPSLYQGEAAPTFTPTIS